MTCKKCSENLLCVWMAQTRALCCSFNARLGRLSWWMDCRQENKSRRSITGQELSLTNPHHASMNPLCHLTITSTRELQPVLSADHQLSAALFCSTSVEDGLYWFCIAAWSKRMKQKKEKWHLCGVWSHHLSHSGRTLTWLDSWPRNRHWMFSITEQKRQEKWEDVYKSH